jgi:hypothetical protein
MSKRKLWYVIAPYSHEDKQISLFRKKHQELIIGFLASNGIFCLDPLANHYVVETLMINGGPSLPTDFAFWDGFCHRSLAACDGVVVCDTIEGWLDSRGVKAEINHANHKKLEFVYASDLKKMAPEEIKQRMW